MLEAKTVYSFVPINPCNTTVMTNNGPEMISFYTLRIEGCHVMSCHFNTKCQCQWMLQRKDVLSCRIRTSLCHILDSSADVEFLIGVVSCASPVGARSPLMELYVSQVGGVLPDSGYWSP
ncbi:hypothetical protein RvY_00960 [Ramazzottius varieornatus]|uniref:Uncharacterized protein n=1 Tax=Ramazzottius varieornatus TaxID=947166 RepID=A0A1D1UI91_RAMVA|nr:hypothetical protein RvY_00960 [Ramazzottius varieornatus]